MLMTLINPNKVVECSKLKLLMVWFKPVLLFLNDNYEGGEFVVADEVYNTKKGSGIIFPSNFMFPHEVKPITKGTRWSIITWIM